jgi:hypothetical protein
MCIGLSGLNAATQQPAECVLLSDTADMLADAT